MHCREIAYDSADYRQSVELRNCVLRQPLGLQMGEEELAADESCFHLGCFVDDVLTGCLVLEPLTAEQIKMRQVAVVSEFQRRGIGTQLVEFAETLATERGYRELVMNARDKAVGFYERLGYVPLGDSFIEVGIAHLKMTKQLADQQD